MTALEFLRKWMLDGEIEAIPPRRETEGDEDPVVWVKFFTPDSQWTWWVTEATALAESRENPGEYADLSMKEVVQALEAGKTMDELLIEDIEGFGLVDGFEKEWGYFSFKELAEVRGPMGLPIEKDMHWTPRPYSQIKSWEFSH